MAKSTKYKFYHYGYEESEYGIECMRCEKDCQLPDFEKTVPHIAFEVEDVYEAIKGKRVIIEQNNLSEGNMVPFIEEDGAPIEFIQIEKKKSRNVGPRSHHINKDWKVPPSNINYSR